MHIRQGKVYLAAVGLNALTSHWIRYILGSLCVLNNNNNYWIIIIIIIMIIYD